MRNDRERCDDGELVVSKSVYPSGVRVLFNSATPCSFQEPHVIEDQEAAFVGNILVGISRVEYAFGWESLSGSHEDDERL